MTRRCVRTLALMFLAAASAAAQPAQQTPPRDTRAAAKPPTPAGTAVLGGLVTSDDGSRPVRFAYIVLIGTTTGVVKVSSTDADGRFTFTNLPADRYTVGASKPPYLGTVAGARRPGRIGTPIAVADGQKVTNVAIRMPMGAAISGVITDERGEPAGGAMVAVMQWRVQGTERALVTAGGMSATDDQGRYRFFGLSPGEYLITALRPGNPTTRALTVAEVDSALKGEPPSPPTPPPSVRYAPVYFPGTTRASDAVAIAIGVGEERANADFRLETVQTSRVEGSLAAGDGQPVGGVPLMVLSSVGSVLSTAMTVRVGPDGRFAIPNLAPGLHTFMVNGTGPLAGQYARATLETTGTDVFGVQLTMRRAMTFSGRLAFEGTAPAPSLAGRRIPIRSLAPPSPGGTTPGLAATNQTGIFTVTGVVPGRYVLGGPLSFGPTADTMTWALHSVVADGRDVTDLPLEIGDTPPGDVIVTYTDRWQGLSGRLQSQSGAPVSDHTIVAFPEDKAYWIPGTRRIVTARPGTDGTFTLSGKGPTTLPPGRYLLAAVTDISKDEQFDPAFLAQLVQAAVPVTLGTGEKKVQDLAIR